MLARFSNCEEAFARTGLGHLEGGCERAMLLLALLAHVAHALRSPAAAFAHRRLGQFHTRGPGFAIAAVAGAGAEVGHRTFDV